MLLFRASMRSLARGVELQFTLRTVVHLRGYRYQVANLEIGAPTQGGLVQWLPLHRVLNNPDFRPEVDEFRTRLALALALAEL